MAIHAYVPGKSSAPGVAKVYKLSSNETPLGPSQHAVEAYRGIAGHLQDYPDGGATDLRDAIGRAFGLDPARIVCGFGSDDLLTLLARVYLADGDEAIHTTHGFLIYAIATLSTGMKPVVAAESDYTADVDAILAAVTPRTRIVFGPNQQPDRDLSVVRRGQARIAACRRGCSWCSTPPMRICAAQRLWVRDRAGGDVGQRRDVSPFSKVHGLAAARLGWMYGPAHAVRCGQSGSRSFNVSAPASTVGIAAIRMPNTWSARSPTMRGGGACDGRNR
jgi:histidinol-phosphate aminotransferase